jgi:hypothetical protein
VSAKDELSFGRLSSAVDGQHGKFLRVMHAESSKESLIHADHDLASNYVCRALAAASKYDKAILNVNSYLYFMIELYLYETNGWIFREGKLFSK